MTMDHILIWTPTQTTARNREVVDTTSLWEVKNLTRMSRFRQQLRLQWSLLLLLPLQSQKILLWEGGCEGVVVVRAA